MNKFVKTMAMAWPIAAALLSCNPLMSQDFQRMVGSTGEDVIYSVAHNPPTGVDLYPMVGFSVNNAPDLDAVVFRATRCGMKTSRWGLSTHAETFTDATYGGTYIAAVGDVVNNSSSTQVDVIFALLSPDGSAVWHNQRIGLFTAGKEDRAMAIREVAPLDFVVAGSTTSYSASGDKDMFVFRIKLLQTGPFTFTSTILWATQIGDPTGDDIANDLVIDAGASLVHVAGSSISMDINDLTGDVMVASLNLATGGVIDQHVYGNNGRQEARAIALDASTGHLVVTGVDEAGAFGGVDGFLLTVDPNSGLAMAAYANFGSSSDDDSRKMATNPANASTFAACGSTLAGSSPEGTLVQFDVSAPSSPFMVNGVLYGGNNSELMFGVEYVPVLNNFVVGGYTDSYVVTGGGQAEAYFTGIDLSFTSANCLLSNWAGFTTLAANESATGNIPGNNIPLTTPHLVNVPFTFGYANICGGPLCKTSGDEAGPNAGEMAAASFTLFPNPAAHEVTLASKGEWGAEAHLIDSQGRKVRTYLVDGANATLDLGGLASGIYLLTRTDATGKAHSSRLVIE